MRLSARRPMVQLTALLDMLLIVMFAQYLEIKTAVVRDKETQDRAVRGQVARVAALEQEVSALQAARRELERSLEKTGGLQEENHHLRQEQAELTDAVRRAVGQRDLLGQLAAELFKLPPDLLEKALKPGKEDSRLSAKELETLKKAFQALAENRAGATTRHLLTWSELRKRSDVWDLTLDDGGLTTFDTGERQQQFRAGTPESFARELFDRYKTAPQPKGLVIVLLSWGETPARWREAALQGLRQAAEKMREDSAGRTRFEYAVLGYRPRDPR